MTRPERAGRQMAIAICETINLMYQNRTALSFLHGLIARLQEAADIRKELK